MSEPGTINSGQITSIQDHTAKTATSQGTAAGGVNSGLFADVDQAIHMGKDASGAFSLEVFNLHGVGDLFIPKGVLSEDIGKTLGDLSKRASSPIVIGAEEAALKGANTAGHSLEFKALFSNVLDASAGISTGKEKPVSVQY